MTGRLIFETKSAHSDDTNNSRRTAYYTYWLIWLFGQIHLQVQYITGLQPAEFMLEYNKCVLVWLDDSVLDRITTRATGDFFVKLI